jgi:hypothetical protein
MDKRPGLTCLNCRDINVFMRRTLQVSSFHAPLDETKPHLEVFVGKLLAVDAVEEGKEIS